MNNQEKVELVKPITKDGCFDNPWPTWRKASSSDLLRWMMFGKNNTNLPSDKKVLEFFELTS